MLGAGNNARRLAVALGLGLPLLATGIAFGAAATAGGTATAPAIAVTAPGGLAGDPIAQPINGQTSAQIARGMYLATAGDCQQCHSVPGQPAYSGGLAMDSPVGAVFTPNITPSARYGIGRWTDAQFWAALHDGISPGHTLLVFPRYMYPSMPYDATSKLSYDDVMAIKAYLESIQPADVADRDTQIPFPFDIRAALLGWRILFFHIQPVQYDPAWSASVRNGAFIVQSLAHCSDCHTPRNLLMGSETDKFLAGGHILSQSWYAPNISSQTQKGGVGAWSQADLVGYLANAGAIGPGAPYGPMQQVVIDSLSRLPKSDLQDIAAYLQQGTAPQPSAMPAAMGSADGGAQVYADHCAGCHGANGEGVANNFPNLAGNQSVWDGPSNNIISMVIGGFYPWHLAQSAMPPFRATLNDDQIAAVSNYVRTSWGNQGTADATGAKVASLRRLTNTEMDLDTASVRAVLDGNGGSQSFDDISGHLTMDGKYLNCQLQAHFGSAATPAAGIDLAGACANGGATLRALVTANGKTSPVTFQLGEANAGPFSEAVVISGPVPGSGMLHAQIALITPNN